MSTPSQASIDAFRALSPDQQKAALGSMSVETKQALLKGLQGGGAGATSNAAASTPPAGVPPPPARKGYLSQIAGNLWEGVKDLTTRQLEQGAPRDAGEKAYYDATGGYTLNPLAPAANWAKHNVEDAAAALSRARAAGKAALATGEDYPGAEYAAVRELPIVGPLIQQAEPYATSPTPGKGLGTEANYFTPEQVGATTRAASYKAIPEAAAATVPPVLRKGAEIMQGTGKEAPTKAPLTQRIAQSTLNIGPKLTERAVKEATDTYETALQKVTEDNAAALKDWREQTVATKQRNTAKQGMVDRKAALQAGVEKLSSTLRDGLQALEKKVRAEGNSRYAKVAERVGDDAVPASNLSPAVEHAQTNIIKGSPENIKQFRDILDQAGGGEVTIGGAGGGGVGPGHPLYEQLKAEGAIGASGQLTFDNLRGYSSELGARLAQGNLPGDVYQAIKSVKAAIDDQVFQLAKKHGADGMLKDANNYWARYKDTFYNTDALAKGGSPVAAAFGATDPTYVTRPFSGPAGSRGVEMLAAYDPRLAQLARNTAKAIEEGKGLPSQAKLKGLPERPTVAGGELKPNPELPTVDPTELKRARVEKLADQWRHLSRYDPVSMGIGALELLTGGSPYALLYTPGHMTLGMLLDQPRVAEWLSRPQPGDFEALGKLPGETQAQLKAAITDKLTSEAKRGQPVSMGPDLKKFLGDAKVQGIMAATASKSRAQQSQSQQLKGVPPPPTSNAGSLGPGSQP